jgi:hypothetical protein
MNSKEENSSEICYNYVQEFGLRTERICDLSILLKRSKVIMSTVEWVHSLYTSKCTFLYSLQCYQLQIYVCRRGM